MKILVSGTTHALDFLARLARINEKPDMVVVMSDDPNIETKRQICHQNEVSMTVCPVKGYVNLSLTIDVDMGA